MNEPLLSESDFRRVAAMLEEHCGLHFHAGNRDILDAGILRLAAAEGLSVTAFGRLLLSPTEELLQRMVQAVTICETYFFRHPEQFAVIAEQALPQLLLSGRRPLRAWSAGCATGEEAYSLAMMLFSYAPGGEAQVLGTDINQAALKAAQRGRYGRHSLREPFALLDAFVSRVPGPSEEFEVAPVIRQLVSFRTHNLRNSHFSLQPPVHEGFDIIFCRNVLVYFAPSRIPQILSGLRDCLREGGYLCVSALDYTSGISGLEPVILKGVPLLRRVSAKSSMRSTNSSPKTPAVETSELEAQPSAISKTLQAAKLAADKGQHGRAEVILRDTLAQKRTPEALHLLALTLGETGRATEMEELLLEAIAINPGYVLGHLSLGLIERAASERWRGAYHLNTVLTLLRPRADAEILHGPECLQVAMARRLAQAGLQTLGGGSL